jgi:DNA-binding NtrC family response regulator
LTKPTLTSRDAAPQHPLDTLLVCRSAAIEHLRAIAARVATGEARVLVSGESGVGKDILARFIHAHSRRASLPFVSVSAVGLPEASLSDQINAAILAARGGTLFVDEISELPLTLQARLLRLLEGGLSAPDGLPYDQRVIASTTLDLGELVAHGQFREDLMYRLNVIHLHVPPLRERHDDVRPLAEWKSRKLGRPLVCTGEAWSALEHYYWPGNVRELSNVVEQLTWTAPHATVRLDDLPQSVRGYAAGGLKPVRERRRQMADEIYTGLIDGRYTFWTDVYEMFMRRDLTRDDLRGLMRRGLTATRGSYRSVLVLFGMPREDYKRLLNFLAAHECALDFREFRAPRSEAREPRVRLEPPGGPARGSNL